MSSDKTVEREHDDGSAEDRPGDWIVTYMGHKFWPLDPLPSEVDIGDIAHALANICRFGGHCREFYSVAQHSVLVAEQFHYSPNALCALLHDGAEAYCGDMVRPLKWSLPEFVAAERLLWSTIARRFTLPAELPEIVKRVDNRMLVTEKRDLILNAARHRWGLEDHFAPYDFTIEPWPAGVARERFLKLFTALRERQAALADVP